LDRRLNVLIGQIDDLLADEASYADLNDEERAAWQASGPTLKALCEKLAAYNIPPTLVHGDFHAGNVTTRDGQILIFDWTDACVAHPFFDPLVFIEYDARDFDADQRAGMRDAYLKHWTDYEPLDRLHEAYELAEILGGLHQAVSYRHIVNAMEPRQRKDWLWGVPYFVRFILPKLKG
jgi:aminoglycoside phosphotransferase (APT) family kinase protein